MENFDFEFYLPTKIIFGKDSVNTHKDILTSSGEKAYIITYSIPGKHLPLHHVTKIFNGAGIDFILETGIEENPSTDTIKKVAKKGIENNVDFIVGIGGGSPIDAAKAVGVLIKNPNKCVEDLFLNDTLKSIPILAIPTTAGTGAEVTHWSIITRNDIDTKQAINPKIYPDYAFIDASYLMGMPIGLTRSTAIDALCHNIESYLSTNSSFLTRSFCEISFKVFSECIDAMKTNDYNYEIREKQMIISLIGGIVNTQTGTLLPHGMSYALTHKKHVPHGLACGLLINEYLSIFKNKEYVNKIIGLCGFSNLKEFGEFIDSMLELNINVTEDEIKEYASDFAKQKHRFKRHPEKVSEADILKIYKNSLLKG